MKIDCLKYLGLFVLVLSLSGSLFSQAPAGFPYQAVVRDDAGMLLRNYEITFRFEILKSTPAGEIVFGELHSAQTNSLGIVNLVVGNGVPETGEFEAIVWGGDDFFLHCSVDIENNGVFELMSLSKFNSVPYALNVSGITLTSPDGKNYTVNVDTLGNLYASEVQHEWHCGDSFIDERDGHVYGTVVVGMQCWMGENLDYGQRIDGVEEMGNNGVIEKYCYNDDPQMCELYGALYQWPEIMYYSLGPGKQGICPDGWHVPTDDELKFLEGGADTQYPVGDPIWNNLGYRGFDAGGNLKVVGTDLWHSPNLGATNSSGFSSLPHGYRKDNGDFANFGIASYIWSSSYTCCYPWYRKLSYTASRPNRNYITEYNGYGLRCLKNQAKY